MRGRPGLLAGMLLAVMTAACAAGVRSDIDRTTIACARGPVDNREAACTELIERVRRAMADGDLARITGTDLLAAAYHARANLAVLRGDDGAAIADYDEAVRIDRYDAAAYFNRGLALARLGRLELAIADYDAAIGVDDRHAPSWANRGLAWARQGDVDRAISDYDAALRLGPNHAATLSNRGTAWTHKRDYRRALADYEAALRLDAGNPVRENAVAWLLATAPDTALRDGARAVVLAESAVNRGPDVANHVDTLAAAYAEAGRYTAAAGTQQRAIELLRGAHADAAALVAFASRLTLYREGRPYRLP